MAKVEFEREDEGLYFRRYYIINSFTTKYGLPRHLKQDTHDEVRRTPYSQKRDGYDEVRLLPALICCGRFVSLHTVPSL